MSTLNSGFKNNINLVAIRSAGSRTTVHTDRNIDYNGDGVKERITSVGVPTGVGSKVEFTVTVNTGAARTIVEGSVAETDANLPVGDTFYTLSAN